MKHWYSHSVYVCEEKQKEQEQELKYDLSKAKGNFAQTCRLNATSFPLLKPKLAHP